MSPSRGARRTKSQFKSYISNQDRSISPENDRSKNAVVGGGGSLIHHQSSIMTKTHENIAQSLLGSKIDSSLPVTYNIKHLNA